MGPDARNEASDGVTPARLITPDLSAPTTGRYPLNFPANRAEPSTRFYGVQILRGLAAILVVLHHQAETYSDVYRHGPNLAILNRGAMGVDIFFPISGFVMYLTAAAVLRRAPQPGAWQHFAWRRFLRVAPMYWFFTLLKLALLFFIPTAMLSYHFMLWNAIGAFLFLPVMNYWNAPEPPLVVGWTLAYEMFFYSIITAAIALRRPLLSWCAAIIIPLALIGLVIPHRWGGLTYLADPIELEFLAGMVIANNIPRIRTIPAWTACVLFAAALAFALGYPIGVEFQPIRPLVWGIPGVIMLLSAVSLEGRLKLSRQYLLLLLGDASFSLYLTHTFIVPATRILLIRLPLSGPAAAVLFFAAGMALCLATAICFHLYVELPLLARLTAFRTPWSLRSAETP